MRNGRFFARVRLFSILFINATLAQNAVTKRRRLSRSLYLSVLAIASLFFLSYFPLAGIRAANAGATILPSAGKPLVNLKSPQTLKVTYTGSADAIAALQGGTATPTMLAAADFDADGAIDLVAAYASGSGSKNGGVLVLLRGNPNAFAPTDPTLYPKAIAGNVPATFLPKASVFEVPESPDLLVTGDFNRDGNQDVLIASRGGNLYLLAGDGTGNLLAPQSVPLPGQVTALAAQADGHVAVSIDGPNGPQLTILAPSIEGLTAGATYSLPERGNAIAWGNLGAGPADLAVGAGANIAIFYNALSANPQTETVTVPFQVKGLALGDFIWDRDARTEISVLADDGSIHILQHGILNTAPITAADVPNRRAAMRTRSKQPANPTSLGAWTVAKQLPYTGSAPSGAVSASAFSSPHLAASSTHDVMVLDAGLSQLSILDTSGTTASPSAAVSFSGIPVAAFAMPQKIDASRDLVVLTSSQASPTLITVDASLTLNVNTTADLDTVNACAANSTVTTAPPTLSLRDAVCIANNNGPSTVTINLPAGTYDLAISTFGGNGSLYSSAELQVGIQSGNNITISGAGASSTIIQQTNGKDRVIEADEELNGNQPLVIQNVAIQLGTCTDLGLDCDFGGGGGGILAGGSGDPLTLTNVTMNDNTANSSSEGMDGGAVYYSGTTFTITGSTFSNNSVSNGAAGGVFAEDFLDFNTDSYLPGSLSITNSSFTGNTSSGDGAGLFFETHGGYPGTISGSTFTGNRSTGTGETGGAIFAETFDTTAGLSSITISNSRIVGNSAPGGGTGFADSEINGTVTNNWWGCNGGPGASGCDTVLSGTGATNSFNPWLVLSVSANPTNVLPSGATLLTADLTHNSVSSGGFSVPNGTPVAFGGTLDSSVVPGNTTLTSGQAISTYTAGSIAGNGTGTATVDNQQVSTRFRFSTPLQLRPARRIS
jgi:hypothetical protein